MKMHALQEIFPAFPYALSLFMFYDYQTLGVEQRERVEEGQHQLFSVCPILCPSLKLVSWDALNALLLHHPHHPSRRDSKFVQQKHTVRNSIQKAELRLHERISQIWHLNFSFFVPLIAFCHLTYFGSHLQHCVLFSLCCELCCNIRTDRGGKTLKDL